MHHKTFLNSCRARYLITIKDLDMKMSDAGSKKVSDIVSCICLKANEKTYFRFMCETSQITSLFHIKEISTKI
jgi:hypothetical protein